MQSQYDLLQNSSISDLIDYLNFEVFNYSEHYAKHGSCVDTYCFFNDICTTLLEQSAFLPLDTRLEVRKLLSDFHNQIVAIWLQPDIILFTECEAEETQAIALEVEKDYSNDLSKFKIFQRTSHDSNVWHLVKFVDTLSDACLAVNAGKNRTGFHSHKFERPTLTNGDLRRCPAVAPFELLGQGSNYTINQSA